MSMSQQAATPTGVDDQDKVAVQGKSHEEVQTYRERAFASRNDAIDAILATRNKELANAGVPGEVFAKDEPKKDDANVDAKKDTSDEPAKKDDAIAAAADNGNKDDTAKPNSEKDDTAAAQVALQTENDVIDLESLKGKKVRVKVDGEERVIDAQRYVADMQKGEAADVRLERAARKEREADERLKAAQTAEAGAKTEQERRDAERKTALASDEYKQSKKDFLAAVYSGDDEKASELLDRVVGAAVDAASKGRSEPAIPDADTLVARTVAATQQQLSVQSALDQGARDYPQIARDEDLQHAVARRITDKRAGGIDTAKAITDAYSEVAAKWRLEKVEASTPSAGRTEPTEPTARDKKLAAKEGIDTIPAASARATKNEPAPQSPSQIIEEMRKQRSTSRV